MFNAYLNNDNNTITIEGRIDSVNAPEAEDTINGLLPESGETVLDAQNLTYISSAGLRVLLRLKKAGRLSAIINVVQEVYEIFDMTGFTEMINIQKAYREVSVEGCEVIGEGANGKVYRISEDTIVKVYKNSDALEEIHNERELARKAFVMGVPTAIPYDVVKVGELYGSVFELLSAKSFAKLLIAEPEKYDELASQSVDILKTIHSTMLKPGELPDKKAEALVWAQFCAERLPEETGSKLLKLISDIPDTLNMLHGDYHIKNIMRQKDENLLIDMDTLAMGHPIFEFAAIFLAYVGFSSADHGNVYRFLGIDYELANKFWHATLRHYFGTDDEKTLKDIENKAAVIGYARLLRRSIRKNKNNDPQMTALAEFSEKALLELVPKTDSLSF